jgi:hypothetical protein
VTQARTVGASLGLAVNGAIMTWALTQENTRVAPEIASQIGEGLTNLSPAAVAALPAAARTDVLAHYGAAFDILFWWVTGIYVVMAVLALMLKDVVIPKRGH